MDRFSKLPLYNNLRPCVGENLHKHSSDQKNMPFGKTTLNDATVALLKVEIESSLESLKVLQSCNITTVAREMPI